jgi:hypothetical protein
LLWKNKSASLPLRFDAAQDAQNTTNAFTSSATFHWRYCYLPLGTSTDSSAKNKPVAPFVLTICIGRGRHCVFTVSAQVPYGLYCTLVDGKPITRSVSLTSWRTASKWKRNIMRHRNNRDNTAAEVVSVFRGAVGSKYSGTDGASPWGRQRGHADRDGSWHPTKWTWITMSWN